MNDKLPEVIEKKNEEKMQSMTKDFDAVISAMASMPDQIRKVVLESNGAIKTQVESIIDKHEKESGYDDGFKKAVIAMITDISSKSETAITALNGMVASSISALQHQTAELREDTQRLYRDLGATGVIKNGSFMDGVKSGAIRYKNIVLSIPMLIISLIMIKSTKVVFVDSVTATDEKVTTENFFSFIKTEVKGNEAISIPKAKMVVASAVPTKISTDCIFGDMVELLVWTSGDKKASSFYVTMANLIADKVAVELDGITTITLPAEYGGAGKTCSLLIPVSKEVKLATNLQLTTLVESVVYVAVAGWNQIAGLFVGLFSASLGDIIQLGKKGLGIDKLFSKKK